MKYLKRFNEATYEELNENLAEEIQWIDDAVIELSDMGYNISINPFEVKSIERPGLTIRIGSTTDGKLLPISIGEYLLTIDSYLKERGFVGFRPYDYDNPYSRSRHDVKVNALLKGVKNMYENELSQFVDMLKRFQVNAPFDSVSVSYYKPEELTSERIKSFKTFETIGYTELTDEMWEDIKDILLELHDEGFFISQDVTDVKKVENKLCEDVIEIIIDKESKEGFSFTEIEDYVRRLIDYMSEFKWNYSLMAFNVYSFHEFECGGPDPLAKVRDDFKNSAEKMLHKSLVDKILQDCTAFKIVFYQKIDHIIKDKYNERYQSIELFNLSELNKDDKFDAIEKLFSELPKEDILDCLMDLTDIGIKFYKEMLTPCLWKGEELIQLNLCNSNNNFFRGLATSDFWNGNNIFDRKFKIRISNLEMIDSIIRTKSQQEVQQLLDLPVIFRNFKQSLTSEVEDFSEFISQGWIPCLAVTKLKLKKQWIHDKQIVDTLQEIRDRVFNLYNYEMIFFPEMEEPSLVFVDKTHVHPKQHSASYVSEVK